MDHARLKQVAESLESEIATHVSQSADARFLATDSTLQSLIEKAKRGTLAGPIDIGGMVYWVMESNIQDYKALTNLLMDFIRLLRGDDA